MWINVTILIVIGSMCVYAGNEVQSLTISSGPVNLQVIPDWQTIPFVDVEVVNAAVGCSDGYEHMYERVWFGMTTACDCLAACDSTADQSTCYNFNKDVVCTDTQLTAGCKQVEPMPTVY